jgi:predicted porin
MKKTLIAMAAVAATGAAMAQSSVTLYGRLDASLAQTTVKINGVKQYPGTKTGIDSSNLSTQFWGLQGSEDLGGGLRAIFKLESNFNIDDGSIGSGQTLFEREANVGLSGGFGTVRFGRVYHAYDTLFGAVNHTDNTNINVSTGVATVGLAHYAVRASNAVRYESPSFGGFRFAGTYGFGENKTATTSATNQYSLAAWYTEGPIMAGVAHQRQESTGPSDLKHNLIGGGYDFGVAKLVGSYQQAKQGGTKDKDWQIGVKVPVGAFNFYVGYADSESKTGATKLKADGWALLGTYALSKRTTAYAGYEAFDRQTNATTTRKESNLALGIRHTF